LNFAPKPDEALYGTALILAFIAGLMQLLPISAAALWAGPGSPFSLTVWLIAGPWIICSLAPLFLIGSPSHCGPILAMISSSAMMLASGYGLVLLARSQKLYDPLYFDTPVSLWAWEGIPFAFNAILMALAIRRLHKGNNSLATLTASNNVDTAPIIETGGNTTFNQFVPRD
jgi:hypothetical protein